MHFVTLRSLQLFSLGFNSLNRVHTRTHGEAVLIWFQLARLESRPGFSFIHLFIYFILPLGSLTACEPMICMSSFKGRTCSDS